MNTILFTNREKRKKKKKKIEWQRGGLVGEKERNKKKEGSEILVLSMGSTIFNLFIKPFNNVTWKLKTSIDEFLKYLF